jgi:hypothetical protein
MATVGNQRFEGDASGCAIVEVAGSQSVVEISHENFSTVRQAAGNGNEFDVVLKLASVTSTVEVTAARTPLALKCERKQRANAEWRRTQRDSRLFSG